MALESAETVTKPTFDQAAESAMATLKADAPKETVETASDDTKTETTETTEQTQSETPPEAPDNPDELLTKEEVATLDEAGKANYKKMQKAFTAKTQKLAAERKEVERLKAYKEFIDKYESDPKATLTELARQQGILPPETAKQEPAKAAAVEQAGEDMQAKLRTLLGEGNEPLADGLAQIFKEGLEKTIDKNLQPIKEQQQAAVREAVASSTEADLKAFEQKHADFKEHEQAMFEISKKFVPNPSSPMEVDEYLEMLYKMATVDAVKSATETDQTKKVIARINKAAASSESKDAAVSESKVTPAKPKRPTIEEAFEAAKKGVAW
jgi:hypothetical protein